MQSFSTPTNTAPNSTEKQLAHDKKNPYLDCRRSHAFGHFDGARADNINQERSQFRADRQRNQGGRQGRLHRRRREHLARLQGRNKHGLRRKVRPYPPGKQQRQGGADFRMRKVENGAEGSRARLGRAERCGRVAEPAAHQHKVARRALHANRKNRNNIRRRQKKGNPARIRNRRNERPATEG